MARQVARRTVEMLDLGVQVVIGDLRHTGSEEEGVEPGSAPHLGAQQGRQALEVAEQVVDDELLAIAGAGGSFCLGGDRGHDQASGLGSGAVVTSGRSPSSDGRTTCRTQPTRQRSASVMKAPPAVRLATSKIAVATI